MELRLTEQIIAIFADAVKSGENAFVIDAFALNVEEGAFGEGVSDHGRRVDQAAAQQRQDKGNAEHCTTLVMHI